MTEQQFVQTLVAKLRDLKYTIRPDIRDRMIVHAEHLTDLMEPLILGWKQRREKEPALMDDLVPPLKKHAGGRTISGLNAYE